MAQFPERKPSTPEETELIVVQRRFDEIGRVAWQAVVHGEDITAEIIDEQKELKERASGVFAKTLKENDPGEFATRYFYELDDAQPFGKKLQFPADHLYFYSHIQGSFQGIRSYPVTHPSPDRNGDIGFRLCAGIEATRVMGWRDDNRTMQVFVPVGEFYLNGFREEEMLQPTS